MTIEEAKEVFINRGYVNVKGGTIFDGDKWRQSVEVITEWLKEQPCEDAISRSEAIRVASGYCHWANIPDELAKLPSVNPKPCEDAISRRAALDLCERFDGCVPHSVLSSHDMLPSVSTEKTGHWIRMKAYEKWGCSECNTVFRFTFKEHNYCPNCGCRMVEPQESEVSDADSD